MPQYETKAIFAANLARWSAAKGETQAQLAALLGVSKSTVSSWFTGEKMPRMDKVELIAEHFGVPKSALLEPPGSQAAMNDFTYALYDATQGLTEESQQKILEMARYFKRLQGGS